MYLCERSLWVITLLAPKRKAPILVRRVLNGVVNSCCKQASTQQGLNRVIMRNVRQQTGSTLNEVLETRVNNRAIVRGYAEGGTRTHTRLPSAVFETAASAIPPLRHVHILYGPARFVSTLRINRSIGTITGSVSVFIANCQ